MKINLTLVLAILVIVMGAVIFLQHKQLNEKDNRVKVPYSIPPQRGAILEPFNSIPTKEYVYIPLPSVPTVDTLLLEKYRRENDSLKKELMYKDAITVREYEEEFVDDLVKFKIKAKVRGSLIDLSVPSYTIQSVDGEVDFLLPPDIDVFVGGEIGIPTIYDTPFLVKINADLRKNKMMYGIGYDTEKRIWARLSYKIL